MDKERREKYKNDMENESANYLGGIQEAIAMRNIGKVSSNEAMDRIIELIKGYEIFVYDRKKLEDEIDILLYAKQMKFYQEIFNEVENLE